MELNEVQLSKYWSIKITTPETGEVSLYLLMCGELGAKVNLRQGELEDASAGFRALAEVLDEAQNANVDVPVVKAEGDESNEG
jgi:hypothetical protein